MAYPVVPGTLIRYDVDGSVVLQRNETLASPWVDVTDEAGSMQRFAELGITTPTGGASDFFQLSFAFPEPLALKGLRWAADSNNTTGSQLLASRTVFVSSDTTDGMGGTWTQVLGADGSDAFQPNTRPVDSADLYRLNIASLDHAGVTGLRLRGRKSGNTNNFGDRFWRLVNIYGEYPMGDRLALWHPTLDQALTPDDLDLGNLLPNSSDQVAFRVKNTHDTLTATDVVVSAEDLSGVEFDSLEVSLDENTWDEPDEFEVASTLSAGAISDPIFIRATIGSTLTYNARRALISASAGAWT